jgi:hypothetical protein
MNRATKAGTITAAAAAEKAKVKESRKSSEQ